MSAKVNLQQLLRNPDFFPTNDVIATALGAANSAYVRFVGELANHDIVIDWRYYSDGKAWLAKGQRKWVGSRGGQKETTAFWLSIWDGFFRVTIYIPERARADILNLSISSEIKQMIMGAKQMGKLKFFPLVFDVCSDEYLEAIHTLVDFRKTLK